MSGPEKLLGLGLAVSVLLTATLIVTGADERERSEPLAQVEDTTRGVATPAPDEPGASERSRAVSEFADEAPLADPAQRKRDAAVRANLLASHERSLLEVLTSSREPLARKNAALNVLFERAPKSEDARRALARLAFVSESSVPADLRRRASRALVASIASTPREEAERLLRLEAAPAELEPALQALAADPNFRPRPGG